MNARTVLARIGRSLRDGDAAGLTAYVFGRFEHVRRAYGEGKGLVQRPGEGVETAAPSLLAPFDLGAAARELQETAVHTGLRMPAEVVRDLVGVARGSALQCPSTKERFRIEDGERGALPSGAPAVLGTVVDVGAQPLVRRLGADPQVCEVARRHLGYRPSAIEPRLMWSFVTNVSDEVRRRVSQTIDYHFDVHHFNFVYANYYLTDTDARSGAHAMILGSHRDKPLTWMLGSARQPAERVLGQYGAARELVIEGPAGTGFIQDASCYHKAIAPIDRARLLLQFRYF